MKSDLAGICATVPDRLPPEDLCIAGDSGEPEPLLPDLGEGSLLLERLARAEATLEKERAQAPALCAALLDLPPAAQKERMEHDSLLHTWGVCEALLERSLAQEEADPAEQGRLAELVLLAADRLDRDLHAAPVVQDLEARAWASVGRSRLRSTDLGEAEEALREAASCLGRGTGDLLVEARLLEFEAALRRLQGRTREAAALFRQAEHRYKEIHDPDLAARARFERERTLNP
jgi:hypothetical protein